MKSHTNKSATEKNSSSIQEMAKILDTFQTYHSEILQQNFAILTIIGHAAIPIIIETLENSPITQIRRNCALALGEIGNNTAIDVLLVALYDKEASVRGAAATAIGKLGASKGVKILLRTIKDRDQTVSSKAAEALAKTGSQEVVQGLLKLLQHKKDYVRFNAIFALSLLKATEAVEPLIGILKEDSSSWVRAEGAALALGNIDDLRAVEPLIEALKVEDPRVRYYSALALGWLRNEKALPALYWLQDNDEGEIRGGYEKVKDAAINTIVAPIVKTRN